MNESFNNVAACLSPKKKYPAKSVALLSELLIAVSYINNGFTKFYNKVFDWIGVDDINSPTGHIPQKFLARCNYQQENDAQRKAKPEYKQKHKFGDRAKVLEQILLERTKDKDIGTYKPAIGMNDDDRTNINKQLKKQDMNEAPKHYQQVGTTNKTEFLDKVSLRKERNL